jgi:hypothetical protein
MPSPSFRFHGAIYRWQPTADGLTLKRSGRVVAEVVPDERYPSMFRVKLHGRSISDMINFARAKDAALRLADQALQTRPRWSIERAPMRCDEGAATTPASDVRRNGELAARKQSAGG